MLAIRCIRIAGVYLLVGMVMGIVMGATENFALRPVHAHVNLLGWVGLALAACVFRLWPELGDSPLYELRCVGVEGGGGRGHDCSGS